MYSELNDKEKQAILEMAGSVVFTRANEAFTQMKISNEKRLQMFAFWLNQHGKRGPWEKYESSMYQEAQRIFN